MTVVQEGPTSIKVSWTLVSGATGYRVEYSGGDDTGEESVDGRATSLIITGLQNGLTYTISIVAISPNLPTSSPIIRQVPLGEITDSVLLLISSLPFSATSGGTSHCR